MATIRICGIYKITNNTNGKCYIGQSVNIHKRWGTHRTLKNGSGKSAIKDAFIAVGVANFSFEIVEECPQELLNAREIAWIEKENCVSPNGYNLKSGGNASIVISEETRKKHSKAKLGTKRSLESIARQKESFSHIKDTPEYRKKLSDARKRYKQSAETIQKIADAQKGKYIPLEQKINMARAHMNGKVIVCSNGETYLSTKEAAMACNVHTDSVLRVCNGKYKQAKGYVFWYEEAN